MKIHSLLLPINQEKEIYKLIVEKNFQLIFLETQEQKVRVGKFLTKRIQFQINKIIKKKEIKILKKKEIK